MASLSNAQAGERIRMLERQREEAAAAASRQKAALARETEGPLVQSIGARFRSGAAHVDEEFTRRTTGLVTAEQFRQQKRQLLDEIADAAQHARRTLAEDEEKRRQRQQADSAARRAQARTLSFALDEDEDDEDDEEGEEEKEGKRAPEAKKMKKNPFVETSFLPDRERELRETAEREALAREWLAAQERAKQTPIAITYSYWNGTGHRRTLEVPQGTTVARFLELAKAPFRELRAAGAEQLLFVKEDLIIPQHYTFYDLIAARARGKSGPLFHFDVHDDVRLVSDAAVEKDESHAAKLVERAWYDKNKHIFPASRWEVFDPAVRRDTYTIHDTLAKH